MKPTLFHIPIPFINAGLPVKAYGLLLMIGFLSAVYLMARRAARVKGDPDLMLNTAFVALISGVVGARIFFVVHHWERAYADNKHIVLTVFNLCGGGLEFYGAMLGGMVGVFTYLYCKGVSLRMYCDIIAPSLMWGLAFGRLGCFLNGCCWGGQCALPWAVQFPYASAAHQQQWLDRKTTIPAELLVGYANGVWRPLNVEQIEQVAAHQRDPSPSDASASTKPADAAQRARQKLRDPLAGTREQLAQMDRWYGLPLDELRDRVRLSSAEALAVHPAQIYASLNAFLLSLVLSAAFYRRKRHGVVLGLLITLYPITRTILETVRVDNAYDTAGMTISQGVSAGMLAVAALYWIWLYRQPLRSAKAVAFVPPPEPPPARKKRKK